MMKTKTPLNFYFIAIVTISTLLLLLHKPILQILFYAIFIFLYLYVFLGRGSCTVEIKGNNLFVKYIYPWEKNLTFDLFQITNVDYEKGFYDLFSDKTRGGLFVFPKYCADRLILTLRNGDDMDTVFVPINTRIFQFTKIVNNIETFIKKNK